MTCMKWYPTSSSCLLLAGVVIALKISQTVVRADLGDIVPDPGEEEVHRFQQQKIKVGPPASLMRDRGHIQDKDHIREHLDGIIDLEGVPEEEMTEKQLQLHYFKLHDYDQNNKLDGLELMNAMTHYHHDGSPSAEPLTEDDLMNLIDPILRDDDRNRDGYIDYPEYAATQN